MLPYYSVVHLPRDNHVHSSGIIVCCSELNVFEIMGHVG